MPFPPDPSDPQPLDPEPQDPEPFAPRPPEPSRAKPPSGLSAPTGPIEESSIGERDLTDWTTRGGRTVRDAVTGVASRMAPFLRWSVANLAFVLTVVLGAAAFLIAGLLAGEVYEAVTESDGLARLDQPVLDAMVGARSPGLDQAVNWFTHLGGTVGMPLIATTVTVVMVITWRSRTPVVLMVIGAAGSLLLTVLGKDLVGRARPPATLAVPPLESSPSFPSGHTLNATVLIGLMAYLLLLHQRSRGARTANVVVAVVLIVAMGLSRIYLGHHWLTDVVAAWLLGFGWLAAVITGHRLQLTLRSRGTPDPAPR
ncbi:MAG: phosphatase PAP2 family protein [Ornithinibacter sp.]